MKNWHEMVKLKHFSPACSFNSHLHNRIWQNLIIDVGQLLTNLVNVSDPHMNEHFSSRETVTKELCNSNYFSYLMA